MFILYMNKKTKNKNKMNKMNKMNKKNKKTRKMNGGGDKDKIIINKGTYTYGKRSILSPTNKQKYKFDNSKLNNETITLSFNGKYYTYKEKDKDKYLPYKYKEKYYDLKGEELSEYELKNYVNVYDEIIKLKSDDKEIKLNGINIKLGET